LDVFLVQARNDTQVEVSLAEGIFVVAGHTFPLVGRGIQKHPNDGLVIYAAPFLAAAAATPG
jgi:hypothetical protein